jgi:hypothetical protein
MKTSYVELSDFLIVNLHFCVKNIPSQIPCLKRKTTKKRKFCFKIPPKLSEFLLFESMLKIFHFHILNIAKFG